MMRLLTVPRAIANLIHLVFAVILVVLSLHLIHLAIGHILYSFQVEEGVEEILSSIWLITVALAVFDLGGIIFDEITWSGTKKELKEFKWQFTKFLIVIITALLLESLVVFFRVAKTDVTLLMYPALSLFAVCLLIVSLAIYIRFSQFPDQNEVEDAVKVLKLKYARGEIDKTEFREKLDILK